MASLSKLNQALLTQMVGVPENWSAWRKRRIIQITPKDNFSYKLKTSYQFFLPSTFLENALQNSSTDDPDSQDSRKGPFTLKWPLDWFPKGVLMDFSVWNSSGHRITVETRYDSTNLTFEAIVLPQLANLLREHGQLDLYPKLISFERLLRAIITQQTAREEIENRSSTTDSMLDYWKTSLNAFPEHYGNLASNDFRIFRKLLSKINEISEVNPGTGTFSVMSLNPLFVAVDYVKLHTREVKGAVDAGIDAYLQECDAYLDFLLSLTPKRDLYEKVFTQLKTVSEMYYLFIPVEVTAEKDFLIKTEQLIPTEKSWTVSYLTRRMVAWLLNWKFFKNSHDITNIVRRGICKFNSMEYLIDLGKDGSTHIEIECPEPNEVHIVPDKCYVCINNELLPTMNFFRYNSGRSGGLQHYYTSKRMDEVHRVTGSDNAVVKLWIKYSLNWKLRFLYGLGIIIIGTTIIETIVSKETSNYFPLFVSLGSAFILSMRSKEPHVELYLRYYKGTVLMLTAISLLLFIYPRLISLWIVIRRVVL